MWMLNAACRGNYQKRYAATDPELPEDFRRELADIFHPLPAREGVDADTLTRSQAEYRRAKMIAEAKAICRNCPVRQQCEDYAKARGEKYGIWGGKTSRERGYKREDR